MILPKFFKIRPIVAFLFVFMLHFSASAQGTDSTMASNTAATDSALAKADTAAAAAGSTLVSTDIDTTMLSWTGGGLQDAQVKPDLSASYKSFWFYFLIFVLFCVFIGIIGKVIRVYELSNGVHGKSSKINWNRIQGTLFALALALGLYGAYWSYTVQGPMSVVESSSLHGQLLDKMFTVTLVITTIVFVLTHILLFGFSFVYSGSEKRKAYFYPHNNTIERVWTIVPAFVLAGLVLFGFFTWRNITDVSPEDQKKAINLEVIGQQFSWNIRYSGADNQLGLRNYKLTTPLNGLGIDFTDKKSWDDKMAQEIVLPVNRPVRVQIGSKDIIHSFYIPDFKAQINAVPGMSTFFQFTPTVTTAEIRKTRNDATYNYILLCAKICGQNHFNMQKVVTVVTEKEYEEWLAKQGLYYNDDAKKQMSAAAEGKTIESKQLALNH